MKKTSISLIHQSPQTLLTSLEMKISVLTLMRFFVSEIIESWRLFCTFGEFSKFDPHVEETSCQIRAYQFFLLGLKISDEYYYKIIVDKIEQLKTVLKLIVNQIADLKIAANNKNTIYQKNLSLTESLENFIIRHDLLFEIPESLLLIMRGYFLTRFKKQDEFGNAFINHQKLCGEISIPIKLAKKLVRYHQINLANASVKFVHELLNDLPQYKSLIFVFNYLNYSDDDGRAVLPCYNVMTILLSHMLKQKSPVLIEVHRQCNTLYIDRIHLLFMPSSSGMDFLLVPKSHQIYFSQVCVVIQGITRSSSIR